jgi:hypothetical protein
MHPPDEWPQRYARIGGLLYLLVIVAAMFGESFVRGTLIVSGNPAATAGNILAHESLFRGGLAAEMLTCVADVALALILYVLLRPVSRNIALLGAFFRLSFVAVYSVAKLFEIAALVLLTNTHLQPALEPGQLQALAYACLQIHSLGYGLSLLFFGCCSACFGHLIRQSRYLPRLLGSLLVVAGIGYVIFSLAQMLAPAFAGKWLFPWLMLPGFFGELGLALWLLIRGVDIAKWQQRVPEQA